MPPNGYFSHFMCLLLMINGLNSDIPQERIAALETIAHEAQACARREREALGQEVAHVA